MASKTKTNYMLKGAMVRLTSLLMAMVLTTPICVIFFIDEQMILGVLTAMIPVIIGIYIIRLYGFNSRKIAYMFDSIENNDFSFQFSEGLRSESDRIFNKSLNRIKELMLATTLRIEENEKYYELIMRQSGAGVIVIDKTGSVYQYNSAALDIFGLSVFTHVNQLTVLDDKLPTILLDIRPASRATVSFYNERGEVSMSLLSTEIDTRGKNLKIISITNIGSELEGREVESWQRLSRVLTHEIMNSVAPISSLSETLLTVSDKDKISQGLQVINTTSRALMRFVDNYRSLTRIPTPKLTLFNVRPLLERVITLIPDGHVVIENCDEDVMLLSDESMIQQIVLNLAKNGVQAGGEVTFNVMIDTMQHVIIDVKNNGEPISKEDAENIFIPFFTTKEGGSGIGLSLSRQMMRLLGDSLSLINHGSANHPTVFRIMFE